MNFKDQSCFLFSPEHVSTSSARSGSNVGWHLRVSLSHLYYCFHHMEAAVVLYNVVKIHSSSGQDPTWATLCVGHKDAFVNQCELWSGTTSWCANDPLIPVAMVHLLWVGWEWGTNRSVTIITFTYTSKNTSIMWLIIASMTKADNCYNLILLLYLRSCWKKVMLISITHCKKVVCQNWRWPAGLDKEKLC